MSSVSLRTWSKVQNSTNGNQRKAKKQRETSPTCVAMAVGCAESSKRRRRHCAEHATSAAVCTRGETARASPAAKLFSVCFPHGGRRCTLAQAQRRLKSSTSGWQNLCCTSVYRARREGRTSWRSSTYPQFLGVNLAWQTPVRQPRMIRFFQFYFFFLSIFVTDFSLPTGQNDPFRCRGICCVL